MTTSSDPSPVFRPDASLDELLSLAGQKYQLEFEDISAGGVTLSILQIANMREILDNLIESGALERALATLPLWAKIWPASVILGHFLRHIPPAGHSVLEIGAGYGVTGLVAAALGFPSVCITDINEDALLFARINALKNNLEDRVTVRRADIATDRLEQRFTLILGAEILYLEGLYRPLVKFLARHMAPKNNAPAPMTILASDHRREAKRFFKLADKEFTVSHKQIGAKSTDHAPERHLLTLHKLLPLR